MKVEKTARPITAFRMLVMRKAAVDAIPKGGDFVDGLRYLAEPGLGARLASAEQWVTNAIDAILAAKDNKFGDDREAVAKSILDEIKKKEFRVKIHKSRDGIHMYMPEKES